MTVSEKILSRLQEKIESGTTVYVVAKAVGVSHSVIARFLSAERKQIRSETIDRLCDYLGLQLVESSPASQATGATTPKAASKPKAASPGPAKPGGKPAKVKAAPAKAKKTATKKAGRGGSIKRS